MSCSVCARRQPGPIVAVRGGRATAQCSGTANTNARAMPAVAIASVGSVAASRLREENPQSRHCSRPRAATALAARRVLEVDALSSRLRGEFDASR
jgi:hypothetical protein